MKSRLIFVLFALLACLSFSGCSDDGDDGGTVDAATGSLELYATCNAGPECMSGLCHMYGNGEKRCTKTCQVNSDCPAPSTGCSGMGVCKRPGG